MDPAVNKRVVLAAYAALKAGDTAGYFARMSDDVQMTFYGAHSLAGTYRGKADFMERFVPRLRERLVGTIKLHVETVVAEGDLVVVEAQGEARAKDGRPYNNRYSIWLRVRDEKIVEIREYMDTELTKAIFG
jgi:uncharacterized protein